MSLRDESILPLREEAATFPVLGPTQIRVHALEGVRTFAFRKLTVSIDEPLEQYECPMIRGGDSRLWRSTGPEDARS